MIKRETEMVEMKANRWTYYLLLCALLLGCQSTTPTQEWLILDGTIANAERFIIDEHASGRLTDEQVMQLSIPINTALEALARAELELPEDSADFQEYMNIAKDAYAEFKAYKEWSE